MRPSFVPEAPEPGQWLRDRYELCRELGRGGVGRVWAARDHELDVEVALKFMPPTLAHEPGAEQHLRREAQAAIRLAHPNIVRLLHFHAEPDVSFLEMELVNGPSLAHVLAERGPQQEDQVCAWLLQVCAGLADAHRHGVIHLDIKPSNLLLAPDDTLKITDFGVARVLLDTQTRTTGEVTSGTLPYMSPELLSGKHCDERSDLYALGVTAYELLTGRPPFHRGDLYHQHLHEPPPAIPSRAPTLWPIVAQLLAKRPSERFENAAALARTLRGSVPVDEMPLAILCTDVEESTALHASLGDTKVRRLLRRHEEIVREQVSRFGGEEIKTLRDGFLVAFGDVDHGLECAVAIQQALEVSGTPADRALAVRIGMDYGRVLRDGGDLLGQTVTIASRIAAGARPGRIFIGERLREQLSEQSSVDLFDRGLFHLKGLSESIRLFEVIWGPDVAPTVPKAVLPVAADAESPFVGREVELRELERCLNIVEHGQGHFVVLDGDPGIGKSRLAREFLQFLGPRSVATAAGRCVEHLTEAWQPIIECVRGLLHDPAGWNVPDVLATDLAPLADLVPELRQDIAAGQQSGSRREPQEERQRLLGALAGLLIYWARREAITLVIDDLHWADENTVEFLRHLGRRLTPDLNGHSARIFVIVTCRETALSPDHPLNELWTDLEHDHLLTRIPVRGLGAGDVKTMLHDLYDGPPYEQLVAFVFRRSEGNPYFVEEIYRDLAEQSLLDPDQADRQLEFQEEWLVATRVRDVIHQRLLRLSARCRDVLQVAGLMGLRLRFDALRYATGCTEEETIDALEEAMAARVIREWAEGDAVYYAFEHGLAQEVLADEGSIVRRQRTHVRIARALETVYGAAVLDHSTEVAQHLLQAGTMAPPEAMVRYGTAAGDAALARYAFREAARFLEVVDATQARSDGASDMDRAYTQRKLFGAIGHEGDVERARELANAVIQTFEDAMEDQLADEARVEIGLILRRQARQRGALPYFESVAAKAKQSPSHLHAVALLQYAVALDYSDQPGRMLACAQDLKDMAQELNDTVLASRALAVERLWYLNHTRELDRVISLSEHLVSYYRRKQDRWFLCRELGDLAFFQFLTGQVTKALATCEEAIALAENIGTHYELLDNRAVRAICHCFRGAWDQVDQEWEDLKPHMGRVPGTKRLGLLIWARVRTDLWRGHESLNVPSARKNYEDMPLTEVPVMASTALRFSEERGPESVGMLGAVSARVPGNGDGLMWLIAAQALTAGWVNVGEAARGATWHAALAPYRRTLYLTSTTLERARAAAANGWWQQALADFSHCTRLCRREGLRPLLAVALFEKAHMYTTRNRSGDRRRAREARAEAAQIFAALQMQPYLERVGELRDH